LSRFLAALQFLTIIPIPWRREVRPEELGRSAGYFPIVGLIIGLILAGLSGLLNLFLPLLVTNALLIASMVVISGALHVDGFVDTFDGLASHRTAEDRWQVMNDSRAGGFGIVSAVLLLLVKFTSLSSIPDTLLITTLVLMPIVSRWTMVYAIFAYPYAKPSGLGKAFKQGTSWPRFTMATLTALVLVFILSQWLLNVLVIAQLIGLAIMFFLWVITVVVATYFKSKFSGLTGDNYGAINEVAEVCVLIFISLLANRELI
jgi:adenosylcobinamide-GDP ribazoletransferase